MCWSIGSCCFRRDSIRYSVIVCLRDSYGVALQCTIMAPRKDGRIISFDIAEDSWSLCHLCHVRLTYPIPLKVVQGKVIALPATAIFVLVFHPRRHTSRYIVCLTDSMSISTVSLSQSWRETSVNPVLLCGYAGTPKSRLQLPIGCVSFNISDDRSGHSHRP